MIWRCPGLVGVKFVDGVPFSAELADVSTILRPAAQADSLVT